MADLDLGKKISFGIEFFGFKRNDVVDYVQKLKNKIFELEGEKKEAIEKILPDNSGQFSGGILEAFEKYRLHVEKQMDEFKSLRDEEKKISAMLEKECLALNKQVDELKSEIKSKDIE